MSATLKLETPKPSAPGEFFQALRTRLSDGARLVTFYGSPADDSAQVALTAILEEKRALQPLRTSVAKVPGFHSLSREHHTLHIFEREVAEQESVEVHGHPWLKPVRYPKSAPAPMRDYPFYELAGKEIHEVGVGPIHAGVIEPGHFRFMCLGEMVHHLEIQLGYQHRGAEKLLLKPNPRALAPLVETIAGDTSIAHAWAYCAAIEALAGAEISPAAQFSRGIALELERIAMHLAGLSGMATDIAFLPGGTTWGRLRTTAINTAMLLCGSRFGRGWLRPGGARVAFTAELKDAVRANMKLLERDLAPINKHFLEAHTVQHRLKGVSVLTSNQVKELGLVGMAARCAGVTLDARASLRSAPWDKLSIEPVIEPTGDCWARARVRIREIDASLKWLNAALDKIEPGPAPTSKVGALAPNSLAVGVCEGWRGEVVHVLETDGRGLLRHYRVQDPSLRNWFGLAQAMRENEISDFPITNKSFDLSYCGNDL